MNRFEQRSKTAYDKKAADYDSSFEGKFTVGFQALLLKEVPVKNGDFVLDVACGTGRLLHQFASRTPIHGYGVDISDNMIQQAKMLNPNMVFAAGTCDQISFADQMFDVITVSAAYHHFPCVNAFASEAFRLLKTGGALFIAEVYYPPLVTLLCNPFVPLMKDGDVWFYSPREIIRTLEKAGFQGASHLTNGHIQLVRAAKR